MRIIGIDPGYAITGFGVIEYIGNHFELIKAGAIETKAGVPFPNRLQKIYDDMITDLNLGDNIPLIGGQPVSENPNMAKLPEQSKNFYMLSSKGLEEASIITDVKPPSIQDLHSSKLSP